MLITRECTRSKASVIRSLFLLVDEGTRSIVLLLLHVAGLLLLAPHLKLLIIFILRASDVILLLFFLIVFLILILAASPAELIINELGKFVFSRSPMDLGRHTTIPADPLPCVASDSIGREAASCAYQLPCILLLHLLLQLLLLSLLVQCVLVLLLQESILLLQRCELGL